MSASMTRCDTDETLSSTQAQESPRRLIRSPRAIPKTFRLEKIRLPSAIPFPECGQEIVGVQRFCLNVYRDERGYFFETFRRSQHALHGVRDNFVQDNFSSSTQGVLRGLHYQVVQPQSQLVTVLRGSIFDVVADIRVGSPTFGAWLGTNLSEGDQLYMPAGVAHGFLVTSDIADLHYRVTEEYRPENERGVKWDDPDLGIVWPNTEIRTSKRDASFPALADIPESQLPRYDRNIT